MRDLVLRPAPRGARATREHSLRAFCAFALLYFNRRGEFANRRDAFADRTRQGSLAIQLAFTLLTLTLLPLCKSTYLLSPIVE